MNKAELLQENAQLRRQLYRPERSRLTQRRADIVLENREMKKELERYRPRKAASPRKIRRPLRTGEILRRMSWTR